MWYISFRGESAATGGSTAVSPISNILVYHDDGRPHHHPELLPTGGSNPALRELRGFAPRGGLIYVVNAFKGDSKILRYRRDDGGAYAFDRVFADPSTANSILHPFDLTFDQFGRCYVSNQDTNVVTGLFPDGSPQATSQVLTQEFPPPAEFLGGTIVASSVGGLPRAPAPAPPDVTIPLGLQVQQDATGQVMNSVRGVLAWGSILLVADEPADAVKAYEAGTGALIGQIADGSVLKAPVHLLLDGSTTTLYIGSTGTDSVVTYDLSRGLGSPTQPVSPSTFATGVKHVSGLAFGGDGFFYAAERKARKIKRFQPNGDHAGDFITDLPDEPEFLQYVPSS